MPRSGPARQAPNVTELGAVLGPVMKAIAGAVGPHCEVVLHDLSRRDLEHTIVAIENGHVTGCAVGGPSTNLGLELLHDAGADQDEFGYRARTRDGRELRCSSVYFRDGQGHVIAALCINVDTTPLVAARGALDEALNGHASQAPDRGEIFANDINEILDQLIETAIAGTGKAVPLMDRDDRLEVLRTLDERGAFFVKRAVDRVARRLGVSRVTAYNYLERIRAGGS
ncbi:MAG: helix-turn-helix transcriptional regulator [Carbonactinosporaceae bacterium]